MNTCCSSKKKKIDLMIQNPELLRLRLSPQEKYYYTNIFYEHSINEKVSNNKFPALLGLLGTDIAENFALRIFDTFSSDKKSIRLNEYLKYVDVYHYGDEFERCRVTFRLMDKNRDGEINLKEFEEYINLLIAAIRKVHPGSSENLFSSKDIRDLFNKIVNNNKQTFSYQDFEKVYLEKPDLLSWIDYFKNNDEDILYLINNNLRSLLFTLHTFFERFSNVMKETSTTNSFSIDDSMDLGTAIKEIERFCKAIEKKRKVFLNSAGRFNIRTVFEKLTKAFNDPNFNKDHSPEILGTRSTFPPKFDFERPNMNCMNNVKGRVNVANTNLPQTDDYMNGPESKVFDSPNATKDKNKEYLPMFMNVDSQLINDQFKSIKNNINQGMEEINEENIDDEYDEDPLYEKDRMINERRMNVNIGLHKKHYFSHPVSKGNLDPFLYDKKKVKNAIAYNNDISKIDDLVKDNLLGKSFSSSKNEVILFDNSNDILKEEDIVIRCKNGLSNCIEDTTLNEKDFLLKFNSGSKTNQDDFNDGVVKAIKMATESFSKTETNQNWKENFLRKNVGAEFINKSKITNNVNVTINNGNINTTNLNLLVEKKQSKQEFSSPPLIKLFKKMKKLSDICCQSVKWIEQSYKWVENRYLKDHIKKNAKNDYTGNAKQNNANDIRFSVQNIPKVQKKEKKNKDKTSKGKSNLLKATDDNFKILLNVVMGIQLAVQSTPSVKITANDNLDNYMHSLIYSIQTTNFGSKRQETFYIKDYAGIIFNNLRKLYNIDKDTFISSISPQDFITGIIISGSTIIEELCSTGKSGSLFYYTRDGKYILKTISNTEYSSLKKILPNYFRHLYNNKNSLLPKFFGCYKLVKKIKKHKSRVHFVIMQNIFSTNKEIHLRYDLKGSQIGRQVLKSDPKLGFKGINKLSYALKDLDLENNKQLFYVKGDKKETIMEQMQRDTMFLTENNIIDYSLLIGIHNSEIENNASNKNVFDHPNDLKKNKSNVYSLSPNRALNTQINHLASNHSLVLNRNNLEINKESHSVKERKANNLNLDDEVNNSEFSMYNKEINYSDEMNDSFRDQEIKNFDLVDKHPFHDYDDGGIKSVTNSETYFIGIIDILTEYNCAKKMDSKMSCVPPNPYRRRFNEYMNNKFVDSSPSHNSENVEQISEPIQPNVNL